MPTVPGVTGQNPYDSLLDQQENTQQPQVVADDYLGSGFRTSDLPQAPGTVVNPYDKILDESIRRSETLARMTALDTSGKDPEQYAEYLRLGQEIGLPVQAVENDPDQARQIQRLNQWGKMAKESPQVAAWLAVADNGVLAQDDLEALSGMEKVLRGVGDTAIAFPGGINQWIGRGISGFGDIYDAATVSLTGALRDAGVPESLVGSDGFTPTQPGQDGWWMNPANWFRAVGDPIKELGDSAVPEERQNFATDVSGGVGQLIGQVVATRINPFAPLVMNAGSGAEGQATRAEEAGATPEQTAQAVAMGATITAAVEKIGLDLLLERLPPAIQNRAASWIVDKALAGGIEGGQEAVEQIANNLVAQMVYDPNAAIFEGVGESASVGAAVGVIARTIFGVRMRDDHRNVAKSDQTTVDSLVDLASQSTLRQRAPDKFRDLMARLSGDQAANYHVDAQEFNKLYQSKGLNPETVAAEMGVDIDAYRIATLSDGEIAIPLSSYVTKVDKADHAVLSEFGKLTPGGLTPAEAAMDDDTVARQADLMRAGIQAELAGDNRIRDDVTGMLVSRYGQETAEKYGTLMQAWFRTMGERSGVDGYDLYSRYRLRIKNELPGLKNAAPVDTILDPLIERLRSGDIPTEGQARGPTLTEFLSEQGGIMDEAMSGEIRSIAESDRATRRGQRKLVRPDAKFTLDGALEAAVEAGYLPEGAEINDLLDALTGELVTDRPTYSAVNEDTRALNDRMSLLALDEELGRRGIDVSKATNAEIKRALSTDAALNVAALYNQIGSPGSANFRAWFRDSKVVGPNGRPLVVYHGTGEEFNAFDKLRLSQGTGHASSGLGFYFTPSRRSAEGYAEKASNGVPADAVVLEVYLSIQNPYEMTLDEASEFQDPAHSTAVRWMLQSQGYDGVWIPEQNAWVAFEPTQIKSVNNRGTYSLTNPNIYQQSVFHGSPHRGIEQTGFSLQKIGTGEGAQAYGWGLYFASMREVAEAYRRALSETDRIYTVDGERVSKESTDPLLWMAIDALARPDIYKPDTLADRLRDQGAVESNVEIIEKHLDELRGRVEYREVEGGQLYAAEIPDDGDLLDWDAPLPEQPEKVREALVRLGLAGDESATGKDIYNKIAQPDTRVDVVRSATATGQDPAGTLRMIYPNITQAEVQAVIRKAESGSNGARIASEMLLAAGIPGLRYLDGTSRGAGDGSRNYVIWDEGAISDVRTFYQAPGAEPDARGAFGWRPDGGVTITLSAKADASTFIHESAHFFLEVMGDLVQQPDATPQVVEDFRTLLTWAGTDPDQWFGMSVDQRRDAHERVARGFEAYVREGKAPSAELAGPFERFRGWLLAIYRSIRQLDVELSDDVRGVFDRMLASDAEIQRTEAENDYTPLFREAAAAGMSEAQFQSYVELMGQASREARDALAARAVRDVYREREAWWKEEAEGVRKEVEAEVNQSPLYRAWYYLSFGTQPDGSPLPEGTDRVKLDRDWLIAQYGHEWVKKNLLRKRVYSVDGGGDPDLIAAAFGFDSGDAMIQSLANAEPRKAYINAEVARRMRERHGDIMTDAGALEEAAQKAAHNSKRLQALDAEIATLARLVGEPKGTTSQIRRVAESMVARMKLRDINPNSYLRAERKNAKLAQQHAAKGQWAKALEAKRKQALNAHLYDVTLKAKEEGEKIRDYVKRFEKVKLRERLGKVGRLNEVDALLDAYDLRRVSGREIDRRKAQAELVKAIDAGLLIAPRAVVDRMRLDGSRTNYRELTMENLRGLRDVLRQMEKEARNEYEALLYGEKIDLDQKAEEIAAAIVANNKAIEPQLGQEAPAEAVRRYGKQALNAWLRPAAIARLLDGSDNGPMTRLVIQPIRDAVARVLEPMKIKANEDLAALYSKHYTTKEMAAMNERTVVPGLNMSLSRWDVISIALNWGNADNREALIRSTVAGRQPFTQAGIERALSTLTARDWAFVQDSWDYLDSYWPQIKAAQERRRGIAPPKVDALPFTMETADGRTVTLRGGYHPLRYNADLDARARQHEIDMTFEQMRAGTMSAVQSKYGHNQERVGSGGQPVMLSMNVMHQHVNNVIQDIALGDVVMMVDKLLKRQQVRDALVTTGNMDVLETMKLWLKDVATGELAARNGAEKTTQFLRRNFTLSKIGFNVMTAILGVTGVAQTQAVVGSRWMLEGAKDYTKNPKQAIAQVMEQSDFMRLRYEIGAFNKDVADFRQAMRTGAPISKSGGVLNGLIVAFQKSQMPPAFADAAFWMIRSLQMQVDTATWLAGYHKAKAQDMPHAEAVRYADGIVENAQTSGLFSDRGGFERGTFSETTRQSEFVKIWTTLGSYMIAKGNIAFESYKRTDFRSPAQVAGFMGDIGLLFFVEMLLAAAIRGSWPEDEEDWWSWAALTGGEQMLATIPIVREIPSFIRGFGGGGGPLGATMNDIAKVAQQTSQAEVDAALIKAYVNMIGTLTGAPSAQTNRAIDAAWREHVEGEDVNSIEYILGKRQPPQ